MKRLIFSLVIACAGFVFIQASDDSQRRDILLRMPLLSAKNAIIVKDALVSMSGIEKIEACYDVNVMIIEYDSRLIKSEAEIMNVLSTVEINSPIEKIYSSDIPIIRRNYKVTTLLNKSIN